MEQNLYLYLELEGEELDIVPLYDIFAKCSCFGSPVGDTYYVYDPDGTKHARIRDKAYFQARIEYRTQSENPLNDIVCEFLNIFCYEGSEVCSLIAAHDVKLWCSVSTDAPQLRLALKAGTLGRLAALGLDLGLTIVQQGKIFAKD